MECSAINLPHYRCTNNIITITADIAQPVFKAKDISLFAAQCI
jgi:hypothetical protein